MKKIISVFLCIAMLATCCVAFASCGKKTFEIAVVTDVGQLMDGGFNQGTYEVPRLMPRKTVSPTSIISPTTAPTPATTTV